MPPRRSIPRRQQDQIRRRAKELCEYCHTAERWQYVPFTVDHILPVSLGGSGRLDNLALACFHCNRRKADRLIAVDPEEGATVPLFHPRQDVWSEHFIWSGDHLRIIGLTPVGRATIETLALNCERVVNIRAADVAVGRHPPEGDPRQEIEPSDWQW